MTPRPSSPSLAQDIEQSLRSVAASRAAAWATPGLAQRVQALKQWQQARLSSTYADLAAQPRYAKASAYFFNEIYGPGDFTQRDTQFERIVPTLVRLFPRDTVTTVALLVQMHALTEALDLDMARALGQASQGAAAPSAPAFSAAASNEQELTELAYAQAWCAVGRPSERERQIALLVEIGRALERLTKNSMLRQGVRLMRGAAAASGLGDLHAFLERGFEAFRAMGGAEEFLATVAARERHIAQTLYSSAN
jgi:hypothetical protein